MHTTMADLPRSPMSVGGTRTVVAYPVVVLAFLGAPLLLVTETVWANRLALAAFRAQFGRSAAYSVLDGGVAEQLGVLVQRGWSLLVLTAVLLVLNRNRPTVWPLLTLLVTVPLGVTHSMGQPIGAERVPGLAGDIVGNPVLPSLLVVAVGYVLAWVGAHRLTTPLTADVARSELELIVPLRGGGRVRLQHDRLVLLPSRAPSLPDRPARLAIPWRAITLVQPGQITAGAQRAEWLLPNGVTLPLPPGPALRIIGAGQQWVIPVDDDGRLTAAIRLRAARSATTRPPHDGQAHRAEITPTQWRHVRDLVAAEHRRQRHNPMRGLLAGRFDFMLTVGLLWLLLAGLSLPGMVEDWTPVYLLAAVVFGLLALLVLRRWHTVSTGVALFEANPREPAAPPWGETDPAEPPAPEWTTGRPGVVPEPN